VRKYVMGLLASAKADGQGGKCDGKLHSQGLQIRFATDRHKKKKTKHTFGVPSQLPMHWLHRRAELRELTATLYLSSPSAAAEGGGGRPGDPFGCCWCHSHPGTLTPPSTTAPGKLLM
jgi:hypothetical protein